MKIEPISAQAKRSGLKTSSLPARAVPTSTGATAAGRVRGREATSHRRSGLRRHPPPPGPRSPRLRSLGELAEVGSALLAVGVTALLSLLGCVEEEVGVVGELLDAGQAVLGSVEACLQEPQRERRQ